MNDKMNEFIKEVSKFKDNGLPYRQAGYDEQIIIQEKIPKLKSSSHNLMAIVFIVLGTLVSYFLFYEENKALMFVVTFIYILFAIMMLSKDKRTKKAVKLNQYLVITGKCINKKKLEED